MLRKVFFMLLLLPLTGCEPAPKDQKLEEAAHVHTEALAISAKVSGLLASVQSRFDSLSDDQKSEFNQLVRQYQEWGDLVVEVPGYEHEQHDHGHDHHHGPNELTGLPSDQVLEIQTELKKQIEVLHTKLEDFLRKISPGSNDGV